MRLLILAVLSMVCSTAFCQFIIRNTNVVDVENKKLVAGQDILVKDGLISVIGKKIQVADGVREIDGSGKYLIPGLVDAHVHFFQSGSIYARPDAIDLRKSKPYEDEIKWVHDNMEAFLRRYLSAGITTVIDVGSNISFLKQRDSFRVKAYAPSIYMTGPLITTWQPSIFRSLGEDEPFFEMKNIQDAKAYVSKQLPFKPDFIKIWFIVNGKNKDSIARANLPMVKAVIDESHRNGLKVAVHATELVTAKLSVEAGADLLVHGVDDGPVDDAFVQLLRNKKTVISPTLVVVGNYIKTFGQTYTVTAEDHKYAHPTPLNSILDLKGVKDTALTNQYKNYVLANSDNLKKEDSVRMSNLKKLSDGGVIIATGTDAGNIGTQHVSSYFDELKMMKASGLDHWQLLQASTINGAKALGKDNEFGSIKKGKRADMVLLSKNPLEDLGNWQTAEWVFNKGNIINPDSAYVRTPVELADQQLAAYNARDLEAFLEPYADDVEIYGFPNKLQAKGKEQMRKMYEFITRTPKLYCRLLNRIVEGNMVIDHEEVWGFGDKPFYGLAIYEIRNGKIAKVYFPE